ncbi:hypothetical protein [Ruegeria sp. 6PALISEP08]|uniref:hypothetical protein n=1 Tax=Ruegeria sp. 6PALISEP08 TaxID=1225660 RepID=UPI0012EE4E5D|nr:hypothetical protein [Ruegeria sp. 6PALISEP08]
MLIAVFLKHCLKRERQNLTQSCGSQSISDAAHAPCIAANPKMLRLASPPQWHVAQVCNKWNFYVADGAQSDQIRVIP